MQFNHEIYLFTINVFDDTKEKINELNQRLQRIGGSAELTESEDGKYNFLLIQFGDDFHKKTTRNAGRHQIYNYSSTYTYGDIRNWKASGIPEKEIFKRLNCTKSTFYRRMKQAKDMGYDDQEPGRG